MPTTTRASDLEGAALTLSPAEAAGPLLAADGLEFSYGHQQVLFGVSVHVGDGEAVALLGTNGAGKSTFLRCVAGLERPSSGRITFLGEDITGRAAEDVVRSGI